MSLRPLSGLVIRKIPKMMKQRHRLTPWAMPIRSLVAASAKVCRILDLEGVHEATAFRSWVGVSGATGGKIHLPRDKAARRERSCVEV